MKTQARARDEERREYGREVGRLGGEKGDGRENDNNIRGQSKKRKKEESKKNGNRIRKTPKVVEKKRKVGTQEKQLFRHMVFSRSDPPVVRGETAGGTASKVL